ncbi:hypothetical protein D1007_17174 [Hordeum vulgare]|nr:hypothetical protein D1007_17174 [Hordeum vulgare]
MKMPDQNYPKLPALHSSAPAAATAEEPPCSTAAAMVKVRGGGAVRGARGQVEKEPPDSALNRGDVAETFEFAINFFPSMAKLVDGSIQNIQRDTIVNGRLIVQKLIPMSYRGREGSEEIGGENWGNCALGSGARDFTIAVGYVPSHLAMQKADDDWASQRHMVPIISDLTIIADGANAHAEEGNVVVVDWNAVELEEPIDLVIAPIADTDMANLFGIPVDDRDEEERDAANTSDNDDIELSEDVDDQLMKAAADDVDDAHDEELVHVYDKENLVIQVGKLWPNMDEFNLSFKTYAVGHQFDAKTVWTDRKKFCAKCRGFDGSGRRACKWYISARLQPDGSTAKVNQVPYKHTCLTSSQKKSSMTSQIWVAKKITPILAKTPNTTAKRLQVDLEKLYPLNLHYTTVWKAKQRAMKNLYGDWANTFRLLFNFKTEVEKRSPGSVVEIDTEVLEDGKVYFSKFFMALKPCIDGFKAGCRPFLSIDSSFLTGKWNGQLAACNALDGHNWMFPVAIGLFRSGFNTAVKCDHINNTLAESFNNKVKQLKDLHVHDMVDQIRIMLMRMWELRKKIADCLQGDKLPAVVQQVVNRSRGLTHLSVEKSSLWGAEATGKPCDHAILFLVDQEEWPEVPLEYSMCPPLTKRKADRPKQSRFKAWFEKGESSKKGKKDKKDAKPKRAQKGNKNRCKRMKLPSQSIVVEQSWPTKRVRVSGSRRKTSQWLEQFGAATEEADVRVHTVETEVVVTEETDVPVHTVETEGVVTEEN